MLLRNDGGTFSDVSAAAGVDDPGPGVAAVWGDMDNDGDLDLFLSNRPGSNALFLNEGDGSFQNIGTPAGVGDPAGYGEGSAWADIDDDGLLDLYVANYSSASSQPNRLFQNLDGFHFVGVASERGVAHMGNGEGIAWADFDNDGDMDLYVANANYGANALFQQQADGNFVDVAVQMHVPGGPLRSFGAAWGDYDNDGWLDLYVAQEGANKLYRNLGGADFADVTTEAGVGGSHGSLGCAWGDIDNDGWLDLHVANNNFLGYDPADILYHNEGGSPITFTEVTAACGLTNTLNAMGNTWGDMDDDGDLDLYVVNQGSGAPNRLFRNDSTPGNWLQIRLIGCTSNCSAIGARVTVASDRTQIREVSGGSGFASQDSLPAEFGLDDWTDPVTVTVAWSSGLQTELPGIVADRIITITEPCVDLAGAAKAVSAPTVVPGTPVTYTLTLPNSGDWPAPARLTDTLPLSLTWAGYLTATSGVPAWDPADRRILWAGTISAGLAVTVTYRVTVNPGLAPGLAITNVATVDDGFRPPFDTAPVTLTTFCQELGGVDFASTPPEPVTGQPVTFTAVATGSLPIAFAWAFGDGSTGSGATVVHTYTLGGDFGVTLTATNACGLVAVTRTVAVCEQVHGTLMAWTPLLPLAGESLTLTASAAGEQPITYTWKLDVGNWKVGPVVTHSYALAGDYAVNLTATNRCGQEAVSDTIAVCGGVDQLDLIWLPLTPTAGMTVTLTGSASGTVPITYTWKLDVGSWKEGPVVQHVYGAAGTYTVVLTATNCAGRGVAVTSKVLVVREAARLVYLPIVVVDR